MLRANERDQALAQSAEKYTLEEICNRFNGKLDVQKASDDPRLNGMLGDIWLAPLRSTPTLKNAPILTLEVKSSNFPGSFTLSDFEMRLSQASFVIVEGTLGRWVVSMEDARDHLTERFSGSEKFWVSEPPISKRLTFDELLGKIEERFNLEGK